MKVSAWISVSDLVSTQQTLFERAIEMFDKKSKIFHSFPHSDIFDSLKKAGVDGVELLITHHASDENIAAAQNILDKNAMPVFSIHQSLSNKKNISLGEIERLCQIANIFAAKIVVLHSETLGKKLFDETYIAKLKQLQKNYQVSFGVENMAKTPSRTELFTYNGEAFASVVNKTGLAMTFDTTHLAQVGEDILTFYKTNKAKIVNIHLSDYKKTWLNRSFVSQAYSHLALGEGELPIEEFLMLLKQEHYNGLITMEINAALPQLCDSARHIKKISS